MSRWGRVNPVWCRVWAMILALSIPGASWAGGLFLTEFGTNDVGLAGAGWAARAQDPATLFRNPAGMSLLDGNQALVGAQLLYADVKFTNTGSSAFLGNQPSGNPIDVFPSASGFYTHSLGQDFKVGFGVLSNFGLGLKYQGDWVGRYYGKEAFLAGVSFVPAASYRVNEWLSVGGGLNIMVGQFKYLSAINNGPGGSGDGTIRLQDTTAGVGGQAGVMLEPKKGMRFGVTYYSPVKLDFGSTPSYTNLAPGVSAALNAVGLVGNRVDLGLTVPQHIMVSAYHDLTESLAIMGDVGWEDWSAFGKTDIGVNDTQTSLTTNIPYKDTYHVGVGARYRLNPDWLLNTGFGYDSSMMNDENRTVTTPIGSSYKFGLGAEWQATQKYNIGLNYEFVWGGDLPVTHNALLPGSAVSRGTVVGSFDNVNLHFFAANLRF